MYEILIDCKYGKRGTIVDASVYNRCSYEEKKFFRSTTGFTPQHDGGGFRENYNYESISYTTPYTTQEDPTPSSWGSNADTSSDSGTDFGGGDFGGGGGGSDY